MFFTAEPSLQTLFCFFILRQVLTKLLEMTFNLFWAGLKLATLLPLFLGYLGCNRPTSQDWLSCVLGASLACSAAPFLSTEYLTQATGPEIPQRSLLSSQSLTPPWVP